ncbi:MAG: SIS domain-containing protein [Candidatus Hadarchaeum sp.]|uniref:SIS domain-containing protein n=1 Tax=Candidatus Hadarchaeum sp. TaxID=2883567 RepID=UPI003175C8C1
MPKWLEDELRRIPLWYHIREATDDPRFSPPFHLIEDVHRQPALLRQTFALQDQLSVLAERIVAETYEHLVFIGCGSAFYTSLLASFVFPRLTGLKAESMEAWEFYNYWQPPNSKTLLIIQSATGASFEVLEAAKRAKTVFKLPVFALTNTANSPIESIADVTVAYPTGQKAGPDICVVPTRLMLMYLIAIEVGKQTKFDLSLLARLAEGLKMLPDNVERFLQEQDAVVQTVAKRHYQQTCFFVVGGGPNWFTALETALKIEEESRTPCRAYQTADYPHMAISLLAPDRTTLVIAPPGPSYDRLHTCVRTAKVAGSPTISVVVEGDERISLEAEDIIPVPPVDELLFPIIGTVVGQLFGYYLGVAKGVNPDTLGTDQLSHARAWLTAFPFGTH